MISRRRLLGVSGAVCLAGAARAAGPGMVDATELGLVPGAAKDQSAEFQKAIDRAAGLGAALFLPPGTIRIHSIDMPDHAVVMGLGRSSILELSGGHEVLRAVNSRGIMLGSFQITGPVGDDADPNSGLIVMRDCSDLRIRNCHITSSVSNGIVLSGCAGRVHDNSISGIGGAAIASRDGRGMWFQNNEIQDCGNLGIYVERGESGFDGSIITGNRISNIDWVNGGNGQNGNGVNVFRADGAIVADNVISDCAFSAVRLNATNDCQITGNICSASGEVAVFSEFGFSGSIVSNNIIDGAAQGISITNLDVGGRLAVCNGNIVRNITPQSLTNPDTTPVGIAIEADTVVNGNVVENVPGVGIAMGWGPYMRDLNVADNVIRQCAIGIGVSVVEGVGAVSITDNLIRLDADAIAIAAMEWHDVAEADLAENADQFPLISMAGNRVSR